MLIRRDPRVEQISYRLLFVALAAKIACVTDQTTPFDAPVVESYVADWGFILPADIGASLYKGDLDIVFPVQLYANPPVDLDIHIEIIDISGETEETLFGNTVTVNQTGPSERHGITLHGAADGLKAVDTGALIIAWRIDGPGNGLFGRRSVFASLTQLEVRLLAPTRVTQGRPAPLTVLVRDPKRNAVVPGAEVEAALLPAGEGTPEPVSLFSGSTNAYGELRNTFVLPAGVAAATIRVTVTEDRAESIAEMTVEAGAGDRLYLASDKTIYKPGQNVVLRALALDTAGGAALADTEVTFEAVDAKGNKVFRRRLTTDAYGVAATRVPTDTRVNEGDWIFRVEAGGAEHQLVLPVTRYNLPKMRVQVAMDDAFALPGDDITGSVSALYLFGEPVVGGSVFIEATSTSGAVLDTAYCQTSDEGACDFDLWLQDSPFLDGENDRDPLTITATVTDMAQQEQAGSTGLILSAAPLLVTALAELGALAPERENRVFLLVTDPIGRPLVADLTVTDLGLPIELETDANGAAELSVTPGPGTTDMGFVVSATDGAARYATKAFTMEVAGDDQIFLRTDEAIYAGGETVSVFLVAPADVRRIFVDIYEANTEISGRALDVSGGEATTTIDLPNEADGVLLVEAHGLRSNGEVVQGSRRFMVVSEDRLDVSIEADQETYLPGQEATVSLSVRDSAGVPQVACVGLTVVDEAAFALGGEPAHRLLTFFRPGASLLAGDQRFLGLSAQALLEMPDSPQRELLAELIFAGGIELSAATAGGAVREEEQRVVAAGLLGRITRDGQQLVAELDQMVDGGSLGSTTTERAQTIEQQARAMLDPFGTPYYGDLASDWDDTLELRSAGPDEEHGTQDDITVEVQLGALLYRGLPSYGYGGCGCFGSDFMYAMAAEDGGGEWNANGGDKGFGGTGGTGGAGGTGGTEGAKKVRADFRETIYTNPTLITDGAGIATVSFPMADSITTWRATADASTRAGKIGAARGSLRTFQSFFVDFDLPVTLTQGDEINVSAVVYNYSPSPLTVSVTLEEAGWLEILSAASQNVSLDPSQVRAVSFGIRVLEAGEHEVTLSGSGGGLDDALVRRARVTPAGQPIDVVFSDHLTGTDNHVVTIPADAVEGGTEVVVTVTPGFASEAVEGLEGMMREPSGCFEQTTATAWPNTLVANYLEETGQLTDAQRESTIELVTRGYQRLLTFESPTGGINWWGDTDPGNRILSAIFLWHLKDLESLIEIDTAVRDRTLNWLLAQQNADGSWSGGDELHAGNEILGTSDLRSTAFVAWALAHTEWADAEAAEAARWLASQSTAGDLYATALAANALAMTTPTAADSLFAELDAQKEVREGERIVWPSEAPSWTGAAGDVGAVETTGLVAYALLRAHTQPQNAEGAVRFITASKDALGTWYNTQATMNALRALAVSLGTTTSDAAGTLAISVNGFEVSTVEITLEDNDLTREIDLTGFVASGDNTVALTWTGAGGINYRLNRRVYRHALPDPLGPLTLEVSYDTQSTVVGEPVTATVVANNNDDGVRDQVMVRLGRAPGFSPVTEDLEALKSAGLVSQYEVGTNEVVLYLMALYPGESRQLIVRLTPMLAVVATAPASSIYAYYEPTLKYVVDAALFEVVAP